MSLDTLEEVDTTVEVIPYEDPSDGKDHKTHIVNPPKNIHIWQPGMTAQDIVDVARATRQHVVALCDYTWVPVHNPEKYDTCNECLTIAGEIIKEMG